MNRSPHIVLLQFGVERLKWQDRHLTYRRASLGKWIGEANEDGLLRLHYVERSLGHQPREPDVARDRLGRQKLRRNIGKLQQTISPTLRLAAVRA